MEPYTTLRLQLANSLIDKGIYRTEVIEAIKSVPRHLFVPETYRHQAYYDMALGIGEGQTISQPFIVALMTQALLSDRQVPLPRVLEIGTGSAYQAAILSHIAKEVFSIERVKALYEGAKQILAQLNISNVKLKFADGYQGWDTYAPYDGIIVTAAAEKAPTALLSQLANDARMVIPINDGYGQVLRVITRKGNNYHTQDIERVLFVPMLTGIKK